MVDAHSMSNGSLMVFNAVAHTTTHGWSVSVWKWEWVSAQQKGLIVWFSIKDTLPVVLTPLATLATDSFRRCLWESSGAKAPCPVRWHIRHAPHYLFNRKIFFNLLFYYSRCCDRFLLPIFSVSVRRQMAKRSTWLAQNGDGERERERVTDGRVWQKRAGRSWKMWTHNKILSF